MIRAALALLLGAVPALAQWGRDINPGMGPQLLKSLESDVLALLRAAPAERTALVAGLVERHGVERIEALKRLRNPELREVFVALLDHEDWHVVHRALHALEAYGGSDVVDRAWALLKHPSRRMREKAAITCIRLWDGRKAAALDELVAAERDFHVRRCLEALRLRAAGKLRPERVSEEVVRTYDNGMMATPFLNGMGELASAAPGVRLTAKARTGSARPATADRWAWPLLGWGEEEVSGTSLQPFANLRQNGTVHHTGVDVGACLDGAGYYAAAAGAVRLVHTGSDMGTLIVLEHQLPGGETVNAVYMHGGDTVFVEAGDRVECGQLLGTMGLSFSVENGGHYAHLHYGLYPGAFDMAHNYGYKPVRDGLADWIDPAAFLPFWIDRTAPFLDELRPLDRSLAAAAKELEKGALGRAHALALKERDRAEPGSPVHADAVYLVGLLADVPGRALDRAGRVRDAGYPGAALDQVKEAASACRGIPGSEKLEEAAAAWPKDAAFAKALKGEGKLEAARKRAARLDREKARALYEKLLEDYGDTCLRPRLEAALR